MENDHVSPAAIGKVPGGALHGDQAAAERGWSSLRLCPLWRPPYLVEVAEQAREGHGGADARMTAALFGDDTVRAGGTDPPGRAATERDGALSLLTGLAASRSLDTGQPVRVADRITLDR